MSQKMITLPISSTTDKAVADMAKDWGYKKHGNGGKTGFLADLLACVADKYSQGDSSLDFTLLIEKKTSHDE
ncbi:hypothetical protein [Enterovibrio norvegicus]|uniref:Uncharacterized protein n=1 Tax=Enterovibrio norvegicus TaxID=188144 RepID=A0ABV4L531_9GAMM